MEADRQTMTLPDWGWTAAALLFGAFVGLIVTTMAVMVVFRGLWILVLLALPFILAQLLFDRVLDALINGWKRWRGYPPPEKPVPLHLRTDLPWPRRYGFHAGFAVGSVYSLIAMPPF
ncbi:hypothetical protein [Shinella zoogloeoides]